MSEIKMKSNNEYRSQGRGNSKEVPRGSNKSLGHRKQPLGPRRQQMGWVGGGDGG